MDTLSTYKQNVRKYYEIANETQLTLGLDWYLRAHKFARLLSKRHGIAFDTVCRVIAVISPRLSWERNQSEAETILIAWKAGKRDAACTCLKANRVKAFDILDGQVERLRGPKVTRFYHNILHALDSLEVTIDTHAFRVCVDDPARLYDAGANSGELACAREAYASVAREIGILPHQLQAVCWLVLKSTRQ
jgi:hypothetical protein